MQRLIPFAAVLAIAACSDGNPPFVSSLAARRTASPPGYDAIDLGTLGGADARPFALNDQGQVVGQSRTADGAIHAFLWENGAMQDLGAVAGGVSSAAHAISPTGLVAGNNLIADHDAHLVVWRNGAAADLGPGGSVFKTRAVAINDFGNVLGEIWYEDIHNTQGAVWQGGVRRDLGGLGQFHTESYPNAWNARGQVVGHSYAFEAGPHEYHHPFIWESGRIRDLGVLGPTGPQTLCEDGQCSEGDALAINRFGDVVGWSGDANGVIRPFLWSHGRMRELNALPGLPAVAVAIDDRGRIAGHGGEPSFQFGEGFLWDKGRVTALGSLGGGNTVVAAMSNAGQIVGSSYTADGVQHAFLWSDGQMLDLGTGPQGLALSWAIAVNNRGDVLGVTADDPFFGPTRAILWRRLQPAMVAVVP